MQNAYTSEVERAHILAFAREKLTQHERRQSESLPSEEGKGELQERLLGEGAQDPASQTSFTAGIIPRHEMRRLRMMLHRVTKGLTLCLSENYEVEKGLPKSMFIIIYQTGETIRHKIDGVLGSFGCPHFAVENKELI